jgi:hypothetical protein
METAAFLQRITKNSDEKSVACRLKLHEISAESISSICYLVRVYILLKTLNFKLKAQITNYSAQLIFLTSCDVRYMFALQ